MITKAMAITTRTNNKNQLIDRRLFHAPLKKNENAMQLEHISIVSHVVISFIIFYNSTYPLPLLYSGNGYI